MWTTSAIATSGIASNTPAANAVETRQSVFSMTDEAEAAVLRPVDPGAWSHALRSSLACRFARISASTELADRYFQMIGDADYESMSDPSNDGSALGLETLVKFMDDVANCPRDITSSDVESLQKAGITDADIVRLLELNAFIAYQIRLVAGLAMLAGSRA